MKIKYISLLVASILSKPYRLEARMLSEEDTQVEESTFYDQVGDTFDDLNPRVIDQQQQSTNIKQEGPQTNQHSLDKQILTSLHQKCEEPPYPLSTIESVDIESPDLITYTKTNKQRWQTAPSIASIRVNYITQIELKILHGDHMHLGILPQYSISRELLSTKRGGQIGYTFDTGFDARCIFDDCVRPKTQTQHKPGDVMKLKIDLRKGYQNMEVFKNEHSLGYYFSGFDLETTWYFAVSLQKVNDSIQILSKKEYKA